MDKLKINLIPPEIKEKAKKEAKRSLIVRISVALLGVFILFTASILAVIIFQNVTVQALTTDIESQKNKIGALKEKEGLVFFLKNRIDTINKFGDNHYKQGEFYRLVSALIVEGVTIASLQINKSDQIILTGETSSTGVLDVFFNTLTDPAKNESKITSISVDNLGIAQNGVIRFSLTLHMKEKAQ